MSIAVELSALAEAIARYRFAYLLTTPASGAPHAVAVSVAMEAGELVVDGGGRRTRENALARPAVGLVWPPEQASDYSLIVDGEAALAGEQLRIRPERAVLHRSAAAPQEDAVAGRCGADCIEVMPRRRKP